jgi:hypothetical protein
MSLPQIPTPTRDLIATAHSQQAANVRAAAMDLGTITDEDEEAGRAKRRGRQVRMLTRKYPSRNLRMDHRKPSLRIMGTTDHEIRGIKKNEHES